MRIEISEIVIQLRKKIIFEPINSLKMLRNSIKQGITTLYNVYDCIGSRWITEFKDISDPYLYVFHDGSSWAIYSLSLHLGDLKRRRFLADSNMGYGGYNDNHMFTSREEAELYIQHLNNGGDRLLRSKHSKIPTWMEPVNGQTLVDMLNAGVRDFFLVPDYSRTPTKITVTEQPYQRNDTWVLKATGKTIHNYWFLSDWNVTPGGWSDHFAFASEYAAKEYVKNLNAGGPKFPRRRKRT